MGNSFAYFGPRSLHKRQLSKTKASMQKQPCFSAKQATCEALAGQCAQGDSSLCWGNSAFLIGDLTFHDQLQRSEFRCQPPCMDGFICVGGHPSTTDRTNASFEVVMPCQKSFSKLWGIVSPILGPDLYTKGSCPTQKQPCKSSHASVQSKPPAKPWLASVPKAIQVCVGEALVS